MHTYPKQKAKKGGFGILALLALFMTLLFMPGSASAIDLASARAAGMVGETDSGLLAVPPGASVSGEVQGLIREVNASRQADFSAKSQSTGVAATVVGSRMFEAKIYPSLPSGTWVQIQGKWIKKQ